MKKILFSAAILAAALTSCSKSEINDAPDYTKAAVNFGTYVGTKAEVSDLNDADDKFAIQAYLTGDATMAEATSPAVFMDNIEVTKDENNAWTYSPLKYWPEDESAKITFFAVSVGSEELPDFNALSNGALSFNYTADGASDLLVASVFNTSRNACTDKTVNFNFKHSLAKVVVNAKTDADYGDDATITVTDVDLSYAEDFTNSGVFTYDNSAIADNAWSVAANNTQVELAGYAVEDKTVTNEPVAIITPMMYIPQTNKITATVTYSVTSGNEAAVVNTKSFEIAPTNANTVYTYNVIISLDAVLVSATVDAWDKAQAPLDQE